MDVNERDRRARARDAIERMKILGEPHTPEEAPAQSDRGRGGAPLLRGPGGSSYLLDGAELRPGEVLEVYTNRANGWLRGRFAWTGRPDDPPRLAFGVWDPNGPWDADGLPPWIGDAEIVIPRRAACRRPAR